MTKYLTGYETIADGKCPHSHTSAMACMFCQEGHMTECHQGKTCEEAQCSHYKRYARMGIYE